eukprot:13713845-Heterocapsa_arctica.AAC.1
MKPAMQHDRWQNASNGRASDGAELGTVGVYLATGVTWDDIKLLVRRRGQYLTHAGTIATPGGAMDWVDYKHRAGWTHTEEAFEHAARQAARRELMEESG